MYEAVNLLRDTHTDLNPSKRLATQLDWLRRQYDRSRSDESMMVRDETATGDARNSQSDSDDPRSTG